MNTTVRQSSCRSGVLHRFFPTDTVKFSFASTDPEIPVEWTRKIWRNSKLFNCHRTAELDKSKDPVLGRLVIPLSFVFQTRQSSLTFSGFGARNPGGCQKVSCAGQFYSKLARIFILPVKTNIRGKVFFWNDCFVDNFIFVDEKWGLSKFG